MKKLFVANYKMNGDKNFYKKVNKVLNKLKIADTVVLCPPFVYMPYFNIKNQNIFVGSQDISSCENKQSTGQISATMLEEFNVKYSIIGHSERRAIGETDKFISQKAKYALEKGIIPIICVGEKKQNSDLDVLIKQVEAALCGVQNNEIIFAYEPVWAIGSGLQPSVEQINKALEIIKHTAINLGYNVKVLYGGSVNLKTYKDIKTSNAEGFLMGGVSLKLNDFIAIVKGE